MWRLWSIKKLKIEEARSFSRNQPESTFRESVDRHWPLSVVRLIRLVASDVGTEIRTVDFRLNKKTKKTLISQRSQISANTKRQAIRTQE